MIGALPSCLLPIAYALLIWWISTALIIFLDNLPPRTHRWAMLGATVLLAGALHFLHESRADTSLEAAYLAFTCGLIVWGWQEMSFFMGFVTGPSRAPCPPGCTGWPRFRRAVNACLYHELASLAAGAAVIAATAGGANQVGTWTYVALWAMRMSAKLNVFLGVRNLGEQFIPEHLGHIRSFLRRRAMNPLLPASVIAASLVAVLLVRRSLATHAPEAAFVVALLVLGVIEHIFLVLPVSMDALWAWSLRAKRSWPAGPVVRRLVPAPMRNVLGRAGTPRAIGGDP